MTAVAVCEPRPRYPRPRDNEAGVVPPRSTASDGQPPAAAFLAPRTVTVVTPPLSEATLSRLWAGQRFPASALVTRQGAPLRVLRPGRRGRGPGPDYRDALIAAPSGRLPRGDVALHDDDKFLALAKVHDEMIRAYRAADWAMASEKLARCRERGGDLPLAKLYDIYAERLANHPVVTDAAQWDGIYEASEK